MQNPPERRGVPDVLQCVLSQSCTCCRPPQPRGNGEKPNPPRTSGHAGYLQSDQCCSVALIITAASLFSRPVRIKKCTNQLRYHRGGGRRLSSLQPMTQSAYCNIGNQFKYLAGDLCLQLIPQVCYRSARPSRRSPSAGPPPAATLQLLRDIGAAPRVVFRWKFAEDGEGVSDAFAECRVCSSAPASACGITLCHIVLSQIGSDKIR